MIRIVGTYEKTSTAGETANAFVPAPLPPRNPPIALDAELSSLLQRAEAAISRLRLAGTMVPSLDWLLYSFIRKEAVVSSQIEGTQATLVDLLMYEAAGKAETVVENGEWRMENDILHSPFSILHFQNHT
jgi:Fic family protein